MHIAKRDLSKVTKDDNGPLRSDKSGDTANSTPPPLASYVAKCKDEPRLQRILALQSTLPDAEQHKAVHFYGHPTQSIGTSKLPARSDFTDNGSLPSITDASSSGAPESVATSQGERDMKIRLRMMVEGQEGALQLALHPPLRDLKSEPPILQCPFGLLGCYEEFNIYRIDDWYEHSLTHFRDDRGKRPRNPGPPTACQCCFCERIFRAPDGAQCWREHMIHVAWHHYVGHSLAHARLDFTLVEYLWQEGMMDRTIYRELKAKSVLTPPESPDSAEPYQSAAFTVLNEPRRNRKYSQRGGLLKPE